MADTTTLVPNRKYVRRLIASIIRGASTQFAQVYHYESDELGGQSPVLRIMSSTSERPPTTFQGTFATFGFTLQVLVLYKDTQDGGTWTPENSEDLLDDLEAELASVLLEAEYPKHGLIKSVQQASASRIRKDVIQGKTYLTEYIPIVVEAFYGKA